MKLEKVPEDKAEFYYWLCENVGTKVASLWLDKKWVEFLENLS